MCSVAFKAQSQCRATLEALAAIKNPPVVFARQANIAQGPQQVNNQMMAASEHRAGAEKNEKPQNKLSGGSNELLPDSRTPGAAVGSEHPSDAAGTGATASGARRSIEVHRVRPGKRLGSLGAHEGRPYGGRRSPAVTACRSGALGARGTSKRGSWALRFVDDAVRLARQSPPISSPTASRRGRGGRVRAGPAGMVCRI